MIYLIVFFVSALLIYLYEKDKSKKILLVLGLLLPCILAGLRDESVGTDVSWYPLKIFEASSVSSSFSDYNNTIILNSPAEGLLYRVSSHEFGFVLLEYVVQHLFNNFQILLFFLECLIIIPVYFGLKKFENIKKDKRLWLSMLLYYLFFYNAGLNAIRQFISISFLFYGFSCLVNNDSKKTKKIILSFLAALSFHTGALIGLLYYVAYFFLAKTFRLVVNENKKINSAAIFVFLVMIIGLSFLYISDFKTFILGILNLNRRYISYVSGTFGISGGSFFCIPVIIIYLLNKKNFKNDVGKNYYMYLFFYVVYILCLQLSTGATLNASRISWNFEIFNILSFPPLFKNVIKGRTKRADVILLIAFCVFYWFYKIVFRGYYDTYPYVFFF